MVKLKNNQYGFGAIEGLLVLVVIAIIGFTGWYVWHAKQTTDKNLTSGSSSAPVFNKVKNNTYAGWKTYCDSATKDCFEYPQTWKLSSEPKIAEVVGPSGSVSVEYSNPSSADVGGPQTFHTTSLATLAKADSTLKIIGGYYPSNNSPEYALIDSSLIHKYSLSVGKTTDNVGYFGYSSNGGSASLTASLYGADYAPTPLSPVDSWFSNADAKTALLILQSFYKQ